MADEELEEAPPKSNKMMLIIIAVNVLAALGGGAYFMLAGGDGEAAEGGDGGGGAEAPLPMDGPPTMVKLNPFIVNLYEPGGTRYLKLTIEAEVPGEEASEYVTSRQPVLRNQCIRYLSNLSFADTQGSEKKGEIQKALRKEINTALKRDIVRNVYFTDFVVQ